MRSFVLGLTLMLGGASPLHSQGLRDKISDLFNVGGGQVALFLPGTADPGNPLTVQAHKEHFSPAVAQGNGNLIAFVTNAISGNVANVPTSATSSGSTFRFEGGVPIRTSVSPGPVFGERAQTLGRGRVMVGGNLNRFHFSTLRGVSLRQMRLNFTHVNSDFPGCSATFGGDCALMGIPTLENDVMQFRLSLDLDATVTSFFLTYGLLDRVDIAVAIPMVSASLRGTSEAQIVPFGGPTAAHFFGGTPASPQLSASRSVEGSATGVGDVAARVKVNLSQTARTGFSILGELRFPTGSASDLLGSGALAARGLGVLSARFGEFSPHANVGYLHRRGETQNSAVVATLGFDVALAPWAAIALDLGSELQVGESKLNLPGTVAYDVPFKRTVEPTTIPDVRDDIVNGSLGFKFTTGAGIILVANATIPLNRGGLRSNLLWTAGLEYNF
ncbi:MAG: hypothetical protein HY560_09315 [Gemmatimonadetes bacterium]|nr:hypothetical protein [Gemmatimonadota bacterium]